MLHKVPKFALMGFLIIAGTSLSAVDHPPPPQKDPGFDGNTGGPDGQGGGGNGTWAQFQDKAYGTVTSALGLTLINLELDGSWYSDGQSVSGLSGQALWSTTVEGVGYKCDTKVTYSLAGDNSQGDIQAEYDYQGFGIKGVNVGSGVQFLVVTAYPMS